MNKIHSLLIALLFSGSYTVYAQFPPGGPGSGFDPSKMNIGRFFGKVVDPAGTGIGYATVQLTGKKFNPATKTAKDTILAGQLTEANGDFSLENIPVMGDFELKISVLGYAEMRQTVTFGIKPPGAGDARPAMPPGPPAGGFPGAGMTKFDKDLGNIRMLEDATKLDEVTISGKASTVTLALDRKSYRVDKDLTAAGGTAQDALKNVPSLSVDLDGNVSLRNGAPQIFVDGKPTTLSLDQIAADAIESVEVITNPSAKFDAGGGTAGIVNIVLKKERRLGYNGNVRLGGDSQLGYNLGADLNARGGKFNIFGSAMLNRHNGAGEAETARENLFGNPLANVVQTTETSMKGSFANGRFGVDYLPDNRNTFTLSGNFMRGHHTPQDDIHTQTDYFFPNLIQSVQYDRSSLIDRNFRNLGTSLQYKHLFPKQGAEWTADLNYNQVRFQGANAYTTTYDDGNTNREKQDGTGRGSFLTLQSDFVNPLNDKTKIEGGIKATIRDNRNDNTNTVFNALTNEWNQVPQISDHFRFDDDVYAAYLQGSRQSGSWGIQAGLRAESSLYQGALTDRDSSFTISYPISLFPSAFLTRKLNDGGDQVQMAYTRRVNRPNFFQTMPFTDFTDSLNLRRGNPGLLPEFNNSIEISYQNFISRNHNLLVSVYYKQATNLIASWQVNEYNAALNKEVVVTTYANGNSAAAYGGEFTLKNKFGKRLDVTTNLNVYQSKVDASNVESDLKISRMSAFLKETVQLTLPSGYTLQFNGEYRTKASFTPVTNNDPFRGFGPPTQNTAQGYTRAYWFVDASIKKDFLKNQASLTLSVQDVFATRKSGSYIATDFFTQDSWRIMNPQLVRLNFSFRFGKMDTSLFNRKNNRMNMQGNDMM